MLGGFPKWERCMRGDIVSDGRMLVNKVRKSPGGKAGAWGGLRPEKRSECLSTQGLLDVAEAEEGVVPVPDILEVTEVPVKATVRVSVHVRHPVGAVGIGPETFLFIEGGVPLTLRQLITLLFEDEGRALCAGVDGLLSCQERHALLGRGVPGGDRLERADAELVARLENTSRIREVDIGDVIVDAVELFTVLLHGLVELGCMIVVIGHRDDAEIHEQSEVFGGFCGSWFT